MNRKFIFVRSCLVVVYTLYAALVLTIHLVYHWLVFLWYAIKYRLGLSGYIMLLKKYYTSRLDVYLLTISMIIGKITPDKYIEQIESFR